MYDIIILGSGPGGYVAAIRAAQLGLKVACVDKSSIGGTCLNIGCIPSKSLLDSSLKHYQLLNDYDSHGIHVEGVNLDLNIMMQRKEGVVSQLTAGVEALFKSNKVEFIEGSGKLLSNIQVEIHNENSKETLETRNIVIATGSSPIELNNIKLSKHIVDSEGALKFEEVPKRLVIIGAGVIGLELGSVWARLGSEVVILEAQDHFLPMLDKRISRQVFKEFQNQGLDIRLGSAVLNAEENQDGMKLAYSNAGMETSVQADKVILAVGRKPNVKNLFDDSLLELNQEGFINVNEFCQTSLENVWAIGDVVRGPMLAHKASEEGVMVAERIADHDVGLNYDHVPNVIYTHPEVAWVGLNESQLKDQGIDFKSGSFPFLASGRALASGESAGSVLITADNETDKILGIQVFGPSAAEILQQGLIAMDQGVTSENLSKTIFSHPTVSEALHEATLAMNNKAIHMQNRKKK